MYSYSEDREVFNAFLIGRNHSELNPYYIHLTTNFAKSHRLFNENDGDDNMWNKGEVLYEEFLESDYNKEDKSEYDCIEEFIMEYNKDTYTLIDNRTGKILFKNAKVPINNNIKNAINKIQPITQGMNYLNLTAIY